MVMHDPVLRDVERFDRYRDALEHAVTGQTTRRSRRLRRSPPAMRRVSTPTREAPRLG
jgi:hypothetical protein